MARMLRSSSLASASCSKLSAAAAMTWTWAGASRTCCIGLVPTQLQAPEQTRQQLAPCGRPLPVLQLWHLAQHLRKQRVTGFYQVPSIW